MSYAFSPGGAAPPRITLRVAGTDESVSALSTEEEDRAVRAVELTMVRESLPTEIVQRTTIFAAERIAIDLFAKELALHRIELVDRVLDAPDEAREIVEGQSTRYPGPVSDAVRNSNDLGRIKMLESPLRGLAGELESMLGGRVMVSDAGGIEFMPDGNAPALPFHVTSSLVKSLAGLLIHLRHRATAGELIIIDEPELNLHPDLQRKVARFLAKLVRHGIRLVISTHSDYVIRELSNLVRLGEAGDAGRKLSEQRGYDPDALLRANEVAALFLRAGRLEELPVNANGFTVPSIDDAINDQNADSEAIEFELPPADR
jgi:hypothetical protein